MSHARYIVADVFDGLATLEDGSVDLVVTSPPFLALRSYLPADHPEKAKEIGSEASPSEFLDVMLRVTAELRRVVAPHGSICIELGDTYAGTVNFDTTYSITGSPEKARGTHAGTGRMKEKNGTGWPLAKSKTLIPELYRIALAYGINPLTGAPSPAGQWRIRNVVTWARPNPPVGALGDKWRPATSDVVVACLSGKRYWDDLATRKPASSGLTGAVVGERDPSLQTTWRGETNGQSTRLETVSHPSGAPLLDYWEIPPGGYSGSHYAVFPPELVEPCVKAMCPQRVCRTCGEPSRRITETSNALGVAVNHSAHRPDMAARLEGGEEMASKYAVEVAEKVTLGWTDCGHDDWRPGLVLDPFAGSGTTLLVATGHGMDAVGIDLDERNAVLAEQRVGRLFLEVEHGV